MTAAVCPEATLALLWERVRQQGDMPAFTKAISAILGALRGEFEHEQEHEHGQDHGQDRGQDRGQNREPPPKRGFSMTRTVLSDPVLTQKVLRLANSGMYAAFGQRIHTVSQAVLVLGADAIGHLALGLKLMEDLPGSALNPSLAHVEMEKAVLAGMVAQQVAASAETDDTEEAVVCSMLHTLGRMMVTFYLPEKWAALQDHGGAGCEEGAAPSVLGLPMEELGRCAAQRWGLPRKLIDSMRRIEPAAGVGPLGDDDWLAALSTMSARCADSLWHDDAAGAVTMGALASSYSEMLGVAPESILGAIGRARAIACLDLTIAPLARPAEALAIQSAMAVESTRLRALANQILQTGVAGMRAALPTATAGQMMSMALETLVQGLSFSRSIAFLRNRRDKKYFAKTGVGAGVTDLLAQLVFSDAYQSDVFHASLASDRVIFIENAADLRFVSKLPPWWSGSLASARSFVILPLCSHGQPMGFIYGDWNHSAGAMVLGPAEFTLLGELRALMVKSVELRQKSAT